jgi:hypothetical protein
MSRARLSVVILGILSLGLSSVARANLHVEWIFAKKLDCPSTCQKTGLKYAVPTGVDIKTGKPSFYICVTYGQDEWGSAEWRVGFNRNGEKSCAIAFDGKEHHGIEYYCQCTNNSRPRIFH